jgi:hypothetical protein
MSMANVTQKKHQVLVDSTDWIHDIVLALKEKGLKM